MDDNNEEYESGGGRAGRGRGERSPRQRGHYRGRAKFCTFCLDKDVKIDYKNYETLWRFLTDQSKIRPRRQTGTCARHQRELARAVKRARHLALLPYTGEHIRNA